MSNEKTKESTAARELQELVEKMGSIDGMIPKALLAACLSHEAFKTIMESCGAIEAKDNFVDNLAETIKDTAIEGAMSQLLVKAILAIDYAMIEVNGAEDHDNAYKWTREQMIDLAIGLFGKRK